MPRVGLDRRLAGSLIGGLSPNTDVMIIARILQGTTAGFIGPLSMSIIFQVFPPGKQGMAMGVTSVGVILAPSVGPAIGGVLVDNLSWRYVFLMGIPFSALCLPMAMLYLPGREPDAVRTPFDWNGLLLLSIALVCLLVGLSNGEKEGWGSDVILTYFGIAFVLGWLFIYWQRHYRYPLLNLKLFANRNFAIMSLVGFVFGAGLYGSTYLVPLFLQIIQRMSPTDAGIMMMPAGLTLALVFPLSGRLADRYDLRILISAGILFFACSFYLMNGADPDTSFWTFAWWLILGRIGIGLVMPSLSMGALRELPMELVTQGSGALNFIRQLGGAYGVNLMSLTLARRTNFHTDQLAATQAYGNTEMSEWIEGLRQLLAEAGLVPVEQTAAAMHYLGMVVYRQAMVLGFRDAFLIVSLAFLFTLLPTWLLRNTRKPAPMAPA